MCLTVSIPVSARCQVQRSQRESTFACCSALRAEEATSENARRFKFQVLTSVSSLNDALVLSFSPTMITCVTRLSTWLAQHESTRSPRSARQKGPAGESLEQPKKTHNECADGYESVPVAALSPSSGCPSCRLLTPNTHTGSIRQLGPHVVCRWQSRVCFAPCVGATKRNRAPRPQTFIPSHR